MQFKSITRALRYAWQRKKKGRTRGEQKENSLQSTARGKAIGEIITPQQG